MPLYVDYTDFGKSIKHKLIDTGMSNKELCELVQDKSGKYFDDAILSRICRGKMYPFMEPYVAAIKEILGLTDTA